MKLYYSATSPFVRKCLVSAHELGLRERIELLPATPHPVNRDRTLVACNPLGKVPTLVTDDGAVLYDSRVICEYLNALGDGHLMPEKAAERWRASCDAALADGIMEAAVLARMESARPEEAARTTAIARQKAAVQRGIEALEGSPPPVGTPDIGGITVACALGYLDFRFAGDKWRDHTPRLAHWFETFSRLDGIAQTAPPG